MSRLTLSGPVRATKFLSRILCLVGVLVLAQPGRADDITWIGGNGGWDTVGNWDTATVPGDADRAIFNDSAGTNDYAVGLNLFDRSVGDILFSADIKGVYWKANSNTLTVANSFVMDQPATATALGRIRNGIVAVTNGAGTAVFKVGDSTTGGKGLLVLEQQAVDDFPTVIADRFLMTTNSTLTFSAGTLTILHGSTIDRGATTTFDIGITAGQVANWIMRGGTNSVNYTSTGTTRLGFATGAAAHITVSGSNTLWAIGGTQVNAGHNGAITLTVSDGARVTTKTLRIGNNSTASSNNTVSVDGAGSRMDVVGGFTLGNVSDNNLMTITNGAQVIITNGFATVGGGGTNVAGNLLRVTGAGSLFQVFDLLQVGSGSATIDLSNRVEVLAGAVVRSSSASAATRLGPSAADADNSILIDGAGSLWEVTGPNALRVGDAGPRSTLTIANGGHLTVTATNVAAVVQIGNSASSSNNTAIVTGTGSLWDTGTNGFNVGNASLGNTFVISNGAHVTSKAAPTIPVTVGNAAAGSNNTAIVTGAGSRWDVDGPGGAVITFRVGSASRNNQLIITNGAQVVVTNGIMSVGANAGANGNIVRVSGTGSLLRVSDLLQIGAGTGAKTNSIAITDGGTVRTVSITSATRVGRSAGDDNNSALIDGAGSLWEVAGINGFVVANDGNHNTLTIQNGGALQVTEGSMFVGALANSGNAATITSGSVTVTNATATGVLSVRVGTLTFNGGTIAADYFRATEGSSSVFAFNSGLLAIAGSAVTNGSPFVVGNGVDAATLLLRGGTNSFADGLTIANNATLAGVGHIEGAVTLASGATWAPGLSAGTQTVAGAVVLNAGTTLDYELDSPGGEGDRIEVDGDLTLDGTLNVTDLGGFANGTYTVFSYTGNLTDNTLNVGTLPGGFSGAISNDTLNKLVLLNVTGGGPGDPFATWQFQYFGSTNCATCGGEADFDGDGISNTNEFLAGTVPTNTVSGLRIISAARAGNDITVTWSTAGGKTNILQASTGTANGSFTNNFTDVPGSQTILPGSGDVTTNYTEAGGATNAPARYYRIRLVP
jgi:fibronectin-binding autotransporter adhesin